MNRSEQERLQAEADYYDEAAKRQTDREIMAVLRSDINTLKHRMEDLYAYIDERDERLEELIITLQDRTRDLR